MSKHSKTNLKATDATATTDGDQSDWYLVVTGFLAMALLALIDTVRGPVFPDLLREFHLTDGAGAFFFITASSAALLNNVLAFRWIERIGALGIVKFYSLVACLGLVVVALGKSFPAILFGAALIGTCLGALGVAVNLLIVEGSLPHNRRRLLSFLHGIYGAGSLAAPVIVTFVYGFGFDWHMVFAFLIVAPAVVFLLAIGRSHWPIQPSRKPPGPIAPSSNVASGNVVDQRSLSSFHEDRRALRMRAMTYAGWIGTYVAAELSLSTRLVLVARRDWGASATKANGYLALFFIGMVLGRVGIAVFPPQMKNRTLLALSLLSSGLVYALGLTYGPIWLALTGLTMSIFYPGAISQINDENARDAAYVTSWCIIVQSFTLMAMHFVLGALTDRIGLSFALWIGPLALGGSLVFQKASRPAVDDTTLRSEH